MDPTIYYYIQTLNQYGYSKQEILKRISKLVRSQYWTQVYLRKNLRQQNGVFYRQDEGTTKYYQQIDDSLPLNVPKLKFHNVEELKRLFQALRKNEDDVVVPVPADYQHQLTIIEPEHRLPIAKQSVLDEKKGDETFANQDDGLPDPDGDDDDYIPLDNITIQRMRDEAAPLIGQVNIKGDRPPSNEPIPFAPNARADPKRFYDDVPVYTQNRKYLDLINQREKENMNKFKKEFIFNSIQQKIKQLDNKDKYLNLDLTDRRDETRKQDAKYEALEEQHKLKEQQEKFKYNLPRQLDEYFNPKIDDDDDDDDHKIDNQTFDHNALIEKIYR